MNRHFKVKVIQMLCERLPHFIALEDHQELIIDYKKVVVYNKSSFSRINSIERLSEKSHENWSDPIPIPVPNLEPMGESDVKFTRYTAKYGNSLVHAIDGDYMIISLLFYAKYGVNGGNKIFIYRQKQKGYEESMDFNDSVDLQRNNEISDVRCTSSIDDEGGVQDHARKSRHDLEHAFDKGLSMESAISSSSQKSTSSKRQKINSTNYNSKQVNGLNKAAYCGNSSYPSKKNKKCWVDMQMIYVSLLEAFRQSKSSCHVMREGDSGDIEERSRCVENDSIKAIVFLILCAGTDFSRQLPLIGPMRLWENLPVIADYLIMAVKERNVNMILDVCVAKLYKTIFSKHVGGGAGGRTNPPDWTCTRRNLLNSSLSKSTKDKFPEKDAILTMIKNIFWVMSYWSTVNGAVETPLDGSNGYLWCSKTKKVVFDTFASSPTSTTIDQEQH